LVAWPYVSGRKTVHTLGEVLRVGQRPKHCSNPACAGFGQAWKAAAWLQLAPLYGSYGYDVIAQIGWQRQTQRQRFSEIHASLPSGLAISEAEVRYLYHQQYLPLLACLERQQRERLQRLSDERGLLLSLDGLAPEGGEPQLWMVRELQTGLTVRSGWLAVQDQPSLVAFLQPIADQGWRVVAVLSDKQRSLPPAVAEVFPQAKHAFCQIHYLKNAAAPLAEADESMKIALRQAVRAEVGELIRREGQAEPPGVLTVTGLLPSALHADPPAPAPAAPAAADSRQAVVQDLLRRVRYLLTLKARPPFRLAGLEMHERLTDVVHCLDTLLAQHADTQLTTLRQGLAGALATVQADYTDLRTAADWLAHIAALLDPDTQPGRTGEQVRTALETYLDSLAPLSQARPALQPFYQPLRTVTASYAPGLFYTYDLPGLPRTNNGCESEFRDLTRRLLSTTGQRGLVRRLLQREGAWELIPRPASLAATHLAFAQVAPSELRQEQARVRQHRLRFRLHTRSAKQSAAQLQRLIQRWSSLPPSSSPE
jgi:hypothetical protein